MTYERKPCFVGFVVGQQKKNIDSTATKYPLLNSDHLYKNNNNNNNNNIYLTAIGLSPGGSGFEHIYKYLTLCY
jgi:hypothetical protein